MNCLFCGSEFEQNKKGRKRDYCTKECQLCNNHYNRFLSSLEFIRFTVERKKIFKGDLFALVNELHIKD